MSKKHDLYIRWLTAAYRYYIGHGDTDMCDAEWDKHSRDFFKNKDKYPVEKYPVLHNPNFTGGSLFWLRPDQYPDEAKLK